MTAAIASRPSVWPIVGLLALGALPLTFGILRVLQFAGIVDVMPHVARTFPAAAPIMLHILAATIYVILGAFQFSAAMRRSWPKWHRLCGKVVLLAGALVALSALWLAANYVSATPAGLLLVGLRVTFATGLMASLWLGLAAIRRRDIRDHRKWMVRAYALALGSATQMIVLMLAEMIIEGAPAELERSALVGLAWGLNLGFAEWLIRRIPSSFGGGVRSADHDVTEPVAMRTDDFGRDSLTEGRT